MKSSKNSLRRALFALAVLLASIPLARANDFVAVDSQGVIYDKIKGSNDVIISEDNAVKFSNSSVDLVIPPTITDVSDTGDGGTYNVIGMAKYAFQSTDITSIDIQAPITEIPESAFNYCGNLTTVQFTESVKVIHNYAFRDCSSLTSVTFDAGGLETIEYEAFKWTSELTELNSSTIKTIDGNAFSSSGLQSVSLSAIESLGADTFYSCWQLESINLNDDLKVIPKNCFNSCEMLEAVTLPSNLEVIEEAAFEYCEQLTIANQWPATLREIGEAAFASCASFGKLILKPGIDYGTEAFRYSYISEIEWPDSYVALGSGCFKNTKGMDTVELPDWMEVVPAYLFNATKITTFKCNSGLKKISGNAFSTCPNLTTIELNDNLKRIDSEAFSNCTSLKIITLPAGVSVGDDAFSYCPLTTINFPEQPLTFDYYDPENTETVVDRDRASSPFRNMILASFTFPPYIKKIGDSFFKGWTNLTTVDLANTEGDIPKECFYNCQKLTKVTFSDNITRIKYRAFYNCIKISNPVLPAKLEVIESNAFENCTGMTFLTSTASEEIATDAFKGCTALYNLTLGSALVRKNAFPANNQKIKYLYFTGPEVRLEWDENNAQVTTFAYVTSITFKPGVKRIHASAFKNWWRLTSIVFDDGIEEIGDYAFYYTTNTIFTKLPASLKRIGSYAFGEQVAAAAGNYTGDFSKVTLPSSIEYVAPHAFDRAVNFKEINMPEDGHEFEVGEFAFANTGVSKIEIPNWMKRVPKGLYYRPRGKNYTTGTLTYPADIEEFGDSCFHSCSIAEVILPEHPVVIKPYAFAYNTALRNIELPAWLTELPEGFMCKNTSLSTINLENVEVLGPWSLAYTSMTKPLEYQDKLKKVCHHALWHEDKPGLGDTYGWVSNEWGIYGKVEVKDHIELESYSFAGAPFQQVEFIGCRDTLPSNLFIKTKNCVVKFSECMEEIPDSIFHGAVLTDRCNEFFDIPTHIKRIGKGAYSYIKHTGLINLNLAKEDSQLEVIDDDAFSHIEYNGKLAVMSNYFTIKFPEDAHIKFGKYSFGSISGLYDLTIPAWVKDIPDGCFSGPSHLYYTTFAPREDEDKVLNVGKDGLARTQPARGSEAQANPDYKNLDFSDWQLTLAPRAFLGAHWGKVVFPGNTGIVPDSCFFNGQVTELVLHEGITSIGEHAFRNVSYLKKATLAESITSLGHYAFWYCTGLEAIKIPDSCYELYGDTFKDCSGLKYVDLGQGLEIVHESAFYNCPIETLIWAPGLKTVEGYAFSYTNVSELYFPPGFDPIDTSLSYSGHIVGMRESIFEGCENLTKVTFDNCGRFAMGDNMFRDCSNLVEVTLSPNFIDIPARAFASCSSLQTIDFKNVENIREYAFTSSGITKLESDKISRLASGAFYSCNSLTKVDCKVPEMRLGKEVFSYDRNLLTASFGGDVEMEGESNFGYCSSLKSFSANGKIRIQSYTFTNCKALETVTLPNDSAAIYLGQGAFYMCESLKAFPYLRICDIGKATDAFYNCKSLREIRMPERGSYVDKLPAPIWDDPYPKGIFRGCESLQSIVWPHTEPRFKVQDYEIMDSWDNGKKAPLKALSYAYADNIRVYPEMKIGNFYNWGAFSSNDDKAILYVKRGQKWKYIENNYGQRFDIIEMKDPQVNVEGSLYSRYDIDNNVNRYTGYLRWELPLSDFNEAAPTVAHIYRTPVYREKEVFTPVENPASYYESPRREQAAEEETVDPRVEIAKITFSVPRRLEESEVPDEYKGKNVIAVTATVESEDNSKSAEFDGMFAYPVYDKDGNVDHYTWMNAKQTSTFYYDADSEKRLDAFDYYENRSWFVLKDEFASPDLASAKVPLSYSYTAKVEKYKFTNLVNNVDLEPGTDELLYHENPDNWTSDAESVPFLAETAKALPTINFDGIYSLDRVKADLKRNLPPSTEHSSDKVYHLGWRITSNDLDKKIENKGVMEDLYQYIDLIEIDTEKKRRLIKLNYPIEGHAVDSIDISGLSPVRENMKYQILVHTAASGEFSSPALTIPDKPSFRIVDKIGFDFASDFFKNHESHDKFHLKTTVKMTADVFAMGWNQFIPSREMFHLGAWRTVENLGYGQMDKKARAAAADGSTFDADDENTNLAHHVDGHVDDEEACEDCLSERGLTVDSSGITLTDVFTQPKWTNFNVAYNNRLYVKVPDSMIPGDERWMAVDASKAVDETIMTLIQDIYEEMQHTDEEVVWFDLNGLRVQKPAKGNLYIKATKKGAEIMRL